MIYLDNAATTYPKPEAVRRALCDSLIVAGGNPSRASHPLARAADETVFACRSALAKHFSARPEQTVFTKNATEALNLAIKGLARPGMHILLSDLEHNAVRRPIAALRRIGCSYSVFSTGDGSPDFLLASIAKSLRKNTGMLVCTHASNICSTRLPIAEIGAFCAKRGIRFVVDASQSAGSAALSLPEIRADALCAPGHKGLYGPRGVGFVIFSPRYGGSEIETILEGGSGTASLSDHMPDSLPDRLEAGTLPLPAIAGLNEGIKCVEKLGVEAIYAHECRLHRHLVQRLLEIPRIICYRPETPGGVLLFSVRGEESEVTAAKLGDCGICTRAGLHCAPLAHKTLGTGDDGAVRASFSVYTTEKEVDALADALLALVREG